MLLIDFDVSELGKVRIPQGYQSFVALPKEGQIITDVSSSVYEFDLKDIEPFKGYPWNDEVQRIYLMKFN